MRLQNIEDVRNMRTSIVERYEVNILSKVRLSPQLREASINGSTFKMSNRALYQLCGILGISFHFAMLLSEKMPDIWTQVNERIVQESSKLVTIKIKDEEIIGIFIPKDRYFTLRGFLQIVDRVYEAMDEKTGVGSMTVDVNDESSTAYIYTPKDFAPLQNDFTDIFKFGVGFSVSTLELYSPSVSESLLRLICSNMTYAPAHAGMRFKSRDADRIVASVGLMISEPNRMTKYQEMFQGLQKKKLSYREAEEVHNRLTRIRDTEGNELDLDVGMQLPDIAEKYGYDSLEKVPSSLAWKSTAATHISAYNAVNRLTLVGSHYENISEKTRLDTLIYAGNLMFRKKWDLDNIAPHVELGGLYE